MSESERQLSCPACHADLVYDIATGALSAAGSAPAAKKDLQEALRALKEGGHRREELFRQSIDAQKHKGQRLDQVFREGLKGATEGPVERPLRDIDL